MTNYLWQAIEDAEEDPSLAQLQWIWDLLDAELRTLSEPEQLKLGAEVFTRLATILNSKSEMLILDWETQGVGVEPTLDDFFGLVRSNCEVDMSGLMEPVPESARKICTDSPDTAESSAQNLDTTGDRAGADATDNPPDNLLTNTDTRQTLLELAGKEQPELWAQAIAHYFQTTTVQEIPLLQLQEALQMPMVELWLGLLLGGYQLRQDGGFYDSGAIRVSLK